ncbi:MAG: hypothetical protein ACKOEV_00715 [Cytophagales bacterium]
MTELFLTEKLKPLLPQYQDFLKKEVYPIELSIITRPFRQSLSIIKALREKAKTQKLFAPHLSPEDGGVGLNLMEFAQVSELLGTSPLGHLIFNCNAPDIGNMELIQLTKSDYQKSLQEEDELELNGKMYDIARVEVKDDIYFVYALHDGAEDNLLGFLNEVLKRSSSDKKPVPSQLVSFMTWVYLPVQNEFKFSSESVSIGTTLYLDLYASISTLVESPPPQV